MLKCSYLLVLQRKFNKNLAFNNERSKKMKYITKELIVSEWLSEVNRHLKVSKRAEKKDEKFYDSVYKKQCSVFLSNESNCSIYRDPKEELRKINEYVNESGIDEEERLKRLEFKKIHEKVNAKRIARGIKFEFDEEKAKRKFTKLLNKRIGYLRMLPQNILDRVADIRVLALGYVSAEVKKLLRLYCAELKSTVREAWAKAYLITEDAEKKLKEIIGFSSHYNLLINAVEEKDGDIYIKGEEETIIIENGEIIEGKGKAVYKFDDSIPNSPWSNIIAAELYCENDKFEAHFFVFECNENYEEGNWYLTVSGTDVRLITE